MRALRLSPAAIAGILAVAALPLLIRIFFPGSERYYLHILIQILFWSFIYTGWSLMGRFGLTSLGHGAFTGIGAYVTVLLWNFAGLTPWIGIPVSVIIDREGNIAKKHSGIASKAQFEREIKALL